MECDWKGKFYVLLKWHGIDLSGFSLCLIKFVFYHVTQKETSKSKAFWFTDIRTIRNLVIDTIDNVPLNRCWFLGVPTIIHCFFLFFFYLFRNVCSKYLSYAKQHCVIFLLSRPNIFLYIHLMVVLITPRLLSSGSDETCTH